jgi:hypothetical protein
VSDDRKAGLARYWPVLVVVAVAAAALAVGSTRTRGDDDSAANGPSTAKGKAPALAAFGDEDPLGAPDCDTTTGRLMIPMVYAPNCVPIWDDTRDNGGATYQGVTKDEIKIAIYTSQNAEVERQALEATIGRKLPTQEEDDANRDIVMESLNALWETYGRTVTWTRLNASGAPDDEIAAKADAIRAAEEMKVFAVIGGPARTNAFAAELAARQVVCICTDSQPEENLEAWAPYVWAPGLAATQRNNMVAELVTKLAGHRAEHAGGDLVDEERTFAVVYQDTADGAQRTGAEALQSLLADDGVDVSLVPYTYDLGAMQEAAGTMVARMKADGVTSIVFDGEPFMPFFLSIAATTEAWFPEWVLAGTGLTDTTAAARRYPQDQWRHAFGVSSLIARITPELADKEPNFVQWYAGKKLTSYPGIFELPTLFNGIHLAGPNLTPATFRDGLFSYQPTKSYLTNWGVSWGEHGLWSKPDYAGADDVTLVWWDPDAVGPHEVQEAGEEGQGMYRYVDGGQRYTTGQLATAADPVFFDPTNSVAIYSERPAVDAVPAYPLRTSRTG